MSEDCGGHVSKVHRCRDCGAMVPQDEPAGRGMMNRQRDCQRAGLTHRWELVDDV